MDPNRKVMPIKKQRSFPNISYYFQSHSNTFNFTEHETLTKIQAENNVYQQTNQLLVQQINKVASVHKIAGLQVFQENTDSEKRQLTDFQCDEIDYKARLHSKANIINTNTNKLYQEIEPSNRCLCGCNRGRGQAVPFCSGERNLQILGPGVLLQFLYKRSLAVVLTLVIIIYSIFAVVTNLIGNQADVSDCLEDKYCEFKHEASDENKDYMNRNYSQIQNWLGLLYCLVWIIMLRFIKVIGRVKNMYIDQHLISASDYTVKIQNLPSGFYAEAELLDYFSDLWQKYESMKKEQKNSTESHSHIGSFQNNLEFNNFQMKSLQIIYDMQFTRSMIDKIFQISSQLSALLLHQQILGVDCFIVEPGKQDQYIKGKNDLKQNYELLLDLRKKFLNDKNFRSKLSTTCCLIQFRTQTKRDEFLKYFGVQKVSFLKQMTERLKNICWPKNNPTFFYGNALQIQRAPQPSDILWLNCEKKYSLKRKFLIYFAITVIVIVSFGIQMGLEYAQKHVKEDNTQSDQSQNLNVTILNFSMSIGLLLVNQVLWTSLFYLLDLQYNHTSTDKIVSQMNHALFASSVNSIVLPILTTIIYNKIDNINNLYKSDGLSSMVFEYHISASIGILTGRLINPIQLLKKLSLQIKCIRNKIIRYLSFYKISLINFRKGVKEVNKFYEGPFFDIAENYVFMIGAVFHAAFFCQLQPFIIVLVTALLLIFYFTSRLRLLRLCKIPQMTQLLIFQTAITHAGLVPIFYGVGTIAIFNLELLEDQNRNQINYIPPSIAIGIGLIGFFNPGGFLNRIVKFIMQECSCISPQRILGEEKIEKVILEDDGNDKDSQMEIQIKSFQRDNHKNSKILNQKYGKKCEHQGTTNRIEFYYQNTNSLKLFGFQNILKGREERQVMKEVEFFCQSFFPKYEKSKIRKQNQDVPKAKMQEE